MNIFWRRPTPVERANAIADVVVKLASLSRKGQAMTDKMINTFVPRPELTVQKWGYLYNCGDGSAGVQFFATEEAAELAAGDDDERFEDDIFPVTVKVFPDNHIELS